MSPSPSAPSNSGANVGLWVHHAGQVQGPFGRDFIDAMILAGVYPADVQVVKDGDTGRQNPSVSNTSTSSIEPSTKPRVVTKNENTPPSKPRQPLSRDAKITMAVALAGLAFMLWVIGQLKSPEPRKSSKMTAASSTVDPGHSTTSTLAPYSSNSGKPRPSLPPALAGDGANTNSGYPKYTLPPPRPQTIAQVASNPSSSMANATSSPLIRPLTVSGLGNRGSSFGVASRPPSENSQLYRDESGRVYRVPNSAYYRLLSMSSALGLKKQNMDREGAELTFLAEELDRDRRYLDRSSQYEIDRFNRKVNRLNALNDDLQSLVRDYNQDVNAFNAELERVGTPIR